MERVEKGLFGKSSLKAEHFHRYMFAARMVSGDILDCACGVGYGSEILIRNSNVSSYLGVDPSTDAISDALDKYSNNIIKFAQGSLETLGILNRDFDTVISLETLEHTKEPARAIASIKDVLKADGIFIGSVPSCEYEALCESTYGPNPFHLQRFTKEKLDLLLRIHFEEVYMCSAEFMLGTLFRECTELHAESEDGRAEVIDVNHDGKSIFGSLFFVAGNRESVSRALLALGLKAKFYIGHAKAYVDGEESEAIRAAYNSAAKMLEDRWSVMQSMELMIDNRDRTIVKQEEALENQSVLVECLKSEKHQLLRNVDAMKEAICTMGLVAGRDKLLEFLLSNSNIKAPFSDMAFSLYLFIDRLYRVVQSGGVRDLFFFAREGYLLKEMFDIYQAFKNESYSIRTHYIRVSRRSTFLLSLGSLEDEEFNVLFRQYRKISTMAFLKSLGLDGYVDFLAVKLGVDVTAFGEIKDDLPTDPFFIAMRSSEAFKRIYEDERSIRSAAFYKYLASHFADDIIPNTLHVVDVGWKGSIQDNIYGWYRKSKGQEACIHGYYVGLVAAGSVCVNNLKSGLLFSNLDGRSKGFHVFNENRSLYEILLHANHGSAKGYMFDSDEKVCVIEDDYKEKIMIEEKIEPVSRNIMNIFQRVCAVAACVNMGDDEILAIALKQHSRMVFHPSLQEIDWVLSVSHVENFGVFQESGFGASNNTANFFNRLRFTWHLIKRGKPSELGFWPWLTIRHRAFYGLSGIYSFLRSRQNS